MNYISIEYKTTWITKLDLYGNAIDSFFTGIIIIDGLGKKYYFEEPFKVKISNNKITISDDCSFLEFYITDTPYTLSGLKAIINDAGVKIEITRFGAGDPVIELQDTEGDNYFDTSTGRIFEFESATWVLKYVPPSYISPTWTNLTRPAMPYLGEEGFNTDLGYKEYWDGFVWAPVYSIIKASQVEVDAGLNDLKYITPLTLKNSSQWSSKADFNHNHDSIYYTQTQLDLVFSGYNSTIFSLTNTVISVGNDLNDLEAIRRPLVKEGQTQATNADSITETDNVFHIGATNFGGDFTDLPYNAQYKASVLGGFRVVFGTSVLSNLYRNGGGITLNLDLSFGNDTLQPSAYFAGSPFITWNALANFLNNVSNPFAIINIVNSNVSNPLITTGGPILYGKMIQINNGYFAGAITALKCHINFQSCTFVLGWQQWFNIQQTDIHLRDCVITFTYNILFGMYYGSNVEFRGNTTINFSNDAGGQSLADIASPISGEFRCLGKSYITFNTYGQPNKKSNGQIATDTAIKWVVGSKSVVNWDTLDLQGCIVDYSTGIAIGATVGADIDRTYDLNLFSATKPVISKNFTSSNPNKIGTIKNIVVDENGVWGVNDGGSGSVTSVNGDSGPVVVLDQDEVLDGVVYKRYSQIEKSKLAGIANGATANDTDANLLNRANHTGSQAESTITGLVSDLAAKAPLNSPAFTGTPTGITKTHVGLGNVDNTSDVNKPVSTLQQTALNLKANLVSPALTGTPSAPTATLGTNTTQISTTAFVQAAIAALVDSSPGTLDTLNELAAALGDDPNFATTMTNALANKVNISDVLNALNQTVSGKVLDARQGKVLNDLITALTSTVSSHTGNTSNPHSVTKAQVGLSAVPNTDFTTPIAASTSHIANTSNPHSVTKAQVGLGSVDNTADTAKPVSTAQQTALNLKSNIANPTFTGLVTTPLIKITSGSPALGKVLTSDADGDASWETPASGVTDHTLLSNIGTNTHAQIDTHIANTSNPHSVTKAQVGLGSVDNTSDVGKPVSTAQQTALDLKANLASPTFSGIPAAPTAISGTNTTQLATTAFVTAAVSSGGIVVDNVPTNGSMNAVSSDGTFDALALKSPLASPIFTGLVTTPLIKITGGVPGVGKVLTSDADGDATWETPVAGVTDHTLLSNIGTNTHAQIDSHIANTSNPHSVTKSQVGLSNVPNTDFTSAVTANTAKTTNATHTGEVTGSGALTITNGAVTLAKMADIATSSLIYRKTAGTGVPEVNTLATLKTDLGLTGTNSGDQTSIAGITGTKAQFDTAVTDGNIMYVGDAPTAHTHTASAITDFNTAVAANSAVVANTAKVSNIAETTTSIGTLINGATAKTTPIDADYVGLMDSAASNILKKLSWANIKATLKTYFDTLYVALTGAQTVAGVKTFSSSPIVPTPTTDYQAATKKYVDDNAGGGGSSNANGLNSATTIVNVSSATAPSTGQVLTATSSTSATWQTPTGGGGGGGFTFAQIYSIQTLAI